MTGLAARAVTTNPATVDGTSIMVGRCSMFGGPFDEESAVRPELALVGSSETMGGLTDPYGSFLDLRPTESERGFGAATLDPDAMYCAMRWDYDILVPAELIRSVVAVTLVSTGLSVLCRPVDYGPSLATERMIDLSPGAMRVLGGETDDIVTVALFRPPVA